MVTLNQDLGQNVAPRIVILGGGFGGLHAALRLAGLPWEGTRPEIVLVDRSDRFVFLPLLYELMTGEMQTWEIAPLFREILAGTQIRFLQAEVTGIDLAARQIRLAEPTPNPGGDRTLGYDRLLLALGGETPLDLVPGAAEYAFPFRGLADARRLENHLQRLEASPAPKIRIAVVGGGYSGVELACKLADRLGERGRLRIVEKSDQLLGNSVDFNRQAADRALEARRVWLDWETTVRAIYPGAIALDYRDTIEELPVDGVVWTVGNRIPALVRGLPVAKNAQGQLLTQDTLQLRDDPTVFALGDLAETHDTTGVRLPPTGQAALQAGEVAGWNLWASLSGRPLLPLRYQPLGEMLALGDRSATFSGLGVSLDGPWAYLARRLVYLARLPGPAHQAKVGLSWLLGLPLERLFRPRLPD